jgi:polyadenylate-binding protein
MSQVQVQALPAPQPQQPAAPPTAAASSSSSNSNVSSNNNLNAVANNVSVQGTQFQSPASLYVGDLEANVSEAQLYDVFKQVANVQSIRLCRDVITRRSLGYAYVNCMTAQEASRAIEVLNFTAINGKPIRIMYSHRDPSIRKSGTANIFIKNLDKGIDHKALHDTFSAFGPILSCKVATDSEGQSKGYGFVQFEQEESAQNAIDKLNGMLMNGKLVYVGPFLRRQEREQGNGAAKFCNVYVKNLSDSIADEDLGNKFQEYGPITSAVVMRDAEGKSKCFGFVNFENPDDAARAVENLNGKKFDDKEWYVGRAQKKYEREAELRARFEQLRKERIEKLQGVNLYVKNLDDSIDDDKLKEIFAEFGTITSCKVMRDPNGQSRGSGFVAFSSPEEANRAALGLSNRIIVNKPLYVALAERKEERKARMQAQFAVRSPVGMTPTVVTSMPMYPPVAPGLGQQIFYGQGHTQLLPPQPSGYGYQQQFIPGMRPGGAQMPNFYVPLVRPGQQGQRPGARRTPLQQLQQPQPSFQQQMIPRGSRMMRYPPVRNVPEVPLPGVGGGMLPVPFDMSSVPIPAPDAGISQSLPMGTMASALANATPEQQRTMLGESLYPLVDQLEHDYAAKVTGMLLEMDQTEVLHLLESPEALKAKVAEAMDVLRNVSQQATGPAEQLAALSLNDPLVS